MTSTFRWAQTQTRWTRVAGASVSVVGVPQYRCVVECGVAFGERENQQRRLSARARGPGADRKRCAPGEIASRANDLKLYRSSSSGKELCFEGCRLQGRTKKKRVLPRAVPIKTGLLLEPRACHVSSALA